MKKKIRIGSRDSKLAVIQAEIIRNGILQVHPEFDVELITMKTTGDKILDRSLDKIGGKGLFVKELDKALAEGRVDICVHSLKDLPMEIPEEIPLVCLSKREDPRDVLLLKSGADEAIGSGIIGTSSNRRKIQLKKLYPEAEFKGIRGNVQTRLRKLEEEDYTATILARAGLMRLGMENVIARTFSVEEMIPAAGQGILAVQGRIGEDYSYLNGIHSQTSAYMAEAERGFVAALDGGCSSPIAAYASVQGKELKLIGLYDSGSEGEYRTGEITGSVEHAQKLGEQLAERLRKQFSDTL